VPPTCLGGFPALAANSFAGFFQKAVDIQTEGCYNSCRNLIQKGDNEMELTPPKRITFWISILLLVIGIALFATQSWLAPYGIVVIIIGFVLLALGNLLKKL
jgi:hypothetical protein